MAVIDTFLKLMVEKRAERLVLVSGAVPYLLRAGETIELSMPSLRAEMLGRIAAEITGGQQAGKGLQEGVFRSAEGEVFGYVILPTGEDLRIEVLSAGAPPPPVEDGPLAKAVADFGRAAEVVMSPQPPASLVAGDLRGVIDQAAALEVSDLFLSVGKQPRVRRNGVLSSLDAVSPGEEEILALIPGEESRETFRSKGSVDFALTIPLTQGSRRFRVNVFRHRNGVAAVLRMVRQRIPPLAELGLPEDLLDLVSYASGLVLVTGTSGSGKSTTLAALVDHLNHSRARHVITIEDPVEYEHREAQCLIHQREVGADVESFGAGLRAALRENPDVILLGELRDLDTISAALTAAETGHLVLATLHSGTANSAVSRVVDVFPGHQQPMIRVQLALSLRAVVSQRLVPGRGKKLVPAIEKLVVTPAVATGIREAQDHYIRNAMLTGTEEGMVTLERSLASLVRRGVIDRDTAFRHAMDAKALSHLLG